MRLAKVKAVKADRLEFDNGDILYSVHYQDCCEEHYISFSDLTLEDFEGAIFDLEGNFFDRIEGYGILLMPIIGYSVRVPGYGYNNGYYSENINLIITNRGDFTRSFDVSECQSITD